MSPPSGGGPPATRRDRVETLVRDGCAGDALHIAALYAPFVERTCVSFESQAPDAAEIARRIDAARAGHAWLVAECAGRFAGYAYATRWRGRCAYDWTAETAVYVCEEARGRGVGRALGAALLERLDGLGYRSAVAGIALPNDPSRALHRQLGYRPIGRVERAGWKFGRWVAVEFWECAVGTGTPGERPAGPSRPNSGGQTQDSD
ncbi:MAG: N-acetyltransferase family protein [Planctomycetota bacterium]